MAQAHPHTYIQVLGRAWSRDAKEIWINLSVNASKHWKLKGEFHKEENDQKKNFRDFPSEV